MQCILHRQHFVFVVENSDRIGVTPVNVITLNRLFRFEYDNLSNYAYGFRLRFRQLSKEAKQFDAH